jgi:hypothetical protein
MKTGKLMIILICLLMLLSLAACGGKTASSSATQAPAAASTAAPASGSGGISATPTIDGDALIREKLQNHHGIDRIYNAHHTREEWSATLDRMIGYGAQINEQEKQEIIDYLMSRQQ